MKKINIVFLVSELNSEEELFNHIPEAKRNLFNFKCLDLLIIKDQAYKVIEKISQMPEDEIIVTTDSHFALYSFRNIVFNSKCTEVKLDGVPSINGIEVSFYEYYKGDISSMLNVDSGVFDRNTPNKIMNEIMNDFYSILENYK